MDAMKKLDKEYIQTLKAKKDSILIMVKSFLSSLEQVGASKIDPKLLENLLEKFGASTRAYGFLELSRLAEKYRGLLNAKEYIKNKIKFKASTQEWTKAFQELIEKATKKPRNEGRGEKKKAA